MVSIIIYQAEVNAVFEIGMIEMKEARHIASSPDGKVFVDISRYEEQQGVNSIGVNAKNTNEKTILKAFLQIKTKFAGILGPTESMSTLVLVRCEVGDIKFEDYAPS